MDARLIQLGFLALEDVDARPVFADAVLESGWMDRRVVDLFFRRSFSGRYGEWNAWRHWRVDGWRRPWEPSFITAAARHSHAFVRACVAVMLFGEWSITPWPLTASATWPLGYQTYETTADALRALYPQNRIEEVLYRQSPFFGLTRGEDPARLAGQSIVLANPEDIRNFATGERIDVVAEPWMPRDRAVLMSPREYANVRDALNANLIDRAQALELLAPERREHMLAAWEREAPAAPIKERAPKQDDGSGFNGTPRALRTTRRPWER